MSSIQIKGEHSRERPMKIIRGRLPDAKRTYERKWDAPWYSTPTGNDKIIASFVWGSYYFMTLGAGFVVFHVFIPSNSIKYSALFMNVFILFSYALGSGVCCFLFRFHYTNFQPVECIYIFCYLVLASISIMDIFLSSELNDRLFRSILKSLGIRFTKYTVGALRKPITMLYGLLVGFVMYVVIDFCLNRGVPNSVFIGSTSGLAVSLYQLICVLALKLADCNVETLFYIIPSTPTSCQKIRNIAGDLIQKRLKSFAKLIKRPEYGMSPPHASHIETSLLRLEMMISSTTADEVPVTPDLASILAKRVLAERRKRRPSYNSYLTADEVFPVTPDLPSVLAEPVSPVLEMREGGMSYETVAEHERHGYRSASQSWCSAQSIGFLDAGLKDEQRQGGSKKRIIQKNIRE